MALILEDFGSVDRNAFPFALEVSLPVKDPEAFETQVGALVALEIGNMRVHGWV
jgi:hypothetical protein